MKMEQNKRKIEINRLSCFTLGTLSIALGMLISLISLTVAMPIYVFSVVLLIKMMYWDLVTRMKGFDRK